MMITDRELPDDFLKKLGELEESYLAASDPIRQSGFGGGAQRWRAEREPILDAVARSADFLDVGCANGYLLECLVAWGRQRGLSLTPFGVDFSEKLIFLAKRRFPAFHDNFWAGNAWEWRPDRTFPYIYTLYDCVPEEYLEEYIHRLLRRVVSPTGRLIVGAYGSRSGKVSPFDIASYLTSKGLSVTGRSTGGDPPVAAFAWIDNHG
jgi:SAM-dependent methyltransferase